jgi:superfamily II DNA or RNA helicase
MSLLAGLTRGFIDQATPSPDKYLPKLVVNDKGQGKTVLATVLRHLDECEEFWFTVAFATKSGVMTLLNTLLALESRGVKGKVLVSQYLDFTQPQALRALLQLSNITLKIATTGNFHAKGYLFNKGETYDLLIGSSNLTAGALKVNKEWNLQVSSTGQGELLRSAREVFTQEFEQATAVDDLFITTYEQRYLANARFIRQEIASSISPNAMQVEALANLQALREKGEKKGLLISATGTGKTYLAAFDAQRAGAKKLLFVVHRTTIAAAALQTFQRIFGNARRMGIYTGNEEDLTKDFLFCTVQTLAKAPHLARFKASHFDYLIIDETHRSGAESYQRILTHFQPTFLLGMTATPERTDGYDIFHQFDHNIAYEIRLQRALEEDMLCPFHYFGVTDVTIGGEVMPEHAMFAQLVAKERIAHILEKAHFYGCDSGRVRGLVFCRTLPESTALAEAFAQVGGFRTLALDGSSSEAARTEAINRLESDEPTTQLDYLFTVDIFNEGIDIPRLNQVILLRPTQSAIVFVQQLGRGLRKAPGKEYLTVLDFIGNYATNYLIPLALFGDTTYNKDTLRKLLAAGSSLLPGASTINFDRIAQDRIYASIDTARLNQKRDLVQAYQLLKFTIGRPPLMVDFLLHQARDPFLYVTAWGSFFNFAAQQEPNLQGQLTSEEINILALIATTLANAKRIEEVALLALLLQHPTVSFPQLAAHLLTTYGHVPQATPRSCLRNVNFEFVRTPRALIAHDGDVFQFTPLFAAMVAKPVFHQFLLDSLNFAQLRYRTYLDSPYVGGFFLYQKYARRDVCRILNWDLDESATVYGYKVKDGSCPLFVNYHKAEDIAQSTNYEDGFLNPHEFNWMSKSNRKLTSPEIVAMQQEGLRLPLFIKKSNGEGTDFYYMGEVVPTSFAQTTIPADDGIVKPIVQVNFALTHPVEDTLYHYLTTESGT